MSNLLKSGEFATSIEIHADEQGNLPTEIEILRPVKITKSPTKPDFEVTTSDLHDYVTNFKNGVRKAVPIDIEHGQDPTFGKRAAGWLSDVYVAAKDGTEVLMGKPDWNKLGTELVTDKQFRFISPQFVPKSLGAYEDPEGKGKFFNVLKAVTITNMPLFKGLKSITASEESTGGLTILVMENTISARERVTMKIEEVRIKTPSDLSAEERAFLTEHKSELSASELIGFGIEDKQQTAEEVKAAEDKAKADKAEADRKAAEVTANEGKVTIDATEFSSMKAQIAALEIKANEGHAASEALRTKEAEEFVQTHVKRGVIKAGEAEATAKMILASEDAEGMKKLIENLPDRIIAAGEKGKSEEGSLGNAAAALETKTQELLASDEGKGLTYADAMKKVINANSELSKEYSAELEGKE